MRLLLTTELRFEEFNERKLPKYAILSHRWGPDEVSYQDFLAGKKKGGAGYEKIVKSCEIAARGSRGEEGWLEEIDPCNWIRIDTCCIDKTNGAELSEAINSMYRWYSRSYVCYVHLVDVTRHGDHATWQEYFPSEEKETTMFEFERSQWFTRGWTLQELLAPGSVMFLDKKWIELGLKYMLGTEISAATNIAERYLRNSSVEPKYIAVAEKLTWAASRRTERIEDEAYCLLGLFDINMPLLYGEGHKAFQRLQLEIIKSSDDESIFVFGTPNFRLDTSTILSNVAHSISFIFYEDDEILRPIAGIHRATYSVTNKGLEFQVPRKLAKAENFILPLNCRADRENVFAIALQLEESGGYFRRGACRTLEKDQAESKYPGIFTVPISQVWSRDDLRESGSELIYVELFQDSISSGAMKKRKWADFFP